MDFILFFVIAFVIDAIIIFGIAEIENRKDYKCDKK